MVKKKMLPLSRAIETFDWIVSKLDQKIEFRMCWQRKVNSSTQTVDWKRKEFVKKKRTHSESKEEIGRAKNGYCSHDFIVFAFKDIYSHAPLSTTDCQHFHFSSISFWHRFFFLPSLFYRVQYTVTRIELFMWIWIYFEWQFRQVHGDRQFAGFAHPTLCRHFMNQIKPIKNNSIRLWVTFKFGLILRVHCALSLCVPLSNVYEFACFFFSTFSASFVAIEFIYLHAHCIAILKFCINKMQDNNKIKVYFFFLRIQAFFIYRNMKTQYHW